jgi:hypothetical protein
MHNSTQQPGESPKWCQAKLSTKRAIKGSYKTFSTARACCSSTGFTGKSPEIKNTKNRKNSTAVQPVQNHHSIKLSTTGLLGGAGEAIHKALKQSSTPTNHLGAGVRYKQDQPEQNPVLLINKHTLASQKQSGYETLFSSSSGY